MQRIRLVLIVGWLIAMVVVSVTQTKKVSPLTNRLDSLDGIEAIGGKAEIVSYDGRRALHLTPLPENQAANDSMIAIVTGTDFGNGTIEAEVAGKPRVGVAADSRGFIGIEFRIQDHGARAENLYLRPTNGRADDQLRRNHSVQYESVPDFPWYRLRKESPGMYESYVDLEPGVWTKIKIVVSGTQAKLYINGATQPCLIVNDLKLGDTHGQIALWAHSSTDAYFSNLVVQ